MFNIDNNMQAYNFVCSGKLDELKALVAEDPNLNLNDRKGYDVLHAACCRGDDSIVAYLLTLNLIEPNKVNDRGETPFTAACKSGQIKVVQLMLKDSRVAVNQRSYDGFSPFWLTCEELASEIDHLIVVSQLLKHEGIDPSEKCGEDETSALYLACERGKVDLVRLLLADGRADVNSTQVHGAFPLFVAAQNGHLEIVNLLLAFGKDIDLKKRATFNGNTAAQQGRAMDRRIKLPQESDAVHLRKKTFGPIIADLLDAFEKEPVLTREKIKLSCGSDEALAIFARRISHPLQAYEFAFSGQLDALKALVAENPDVDLNWQGEPKNETALHAACSAGHELVVDYLLTLEQVKVNRKNNNGETPFAKACIEGHIGVVQRMLQDSRIDIKIRSHRDFSPFWSACEKGHLPIVKLLLKHPDIDPSEGCGWIDTKISPFHHACEKANINVLRLLLADPRVNVNNTKYGGEFPLLAAVQKGHLEVVMELILSGREVDPKQTCKDQTAAEWAAIMDIMPKRSDETFEDYERRTTNAPQISALLAAFEDNPDRTRKAIREGLAALLFALTVFHSDGLLEVPKTKNVSNEQFENIARFFRIADSLPLELQMVLCNTAYGLIRELIPSKDSEEAFRAIAKDISRDTKS